MTVNSRKARADNEYRAAPVIGLCSPGSGLIGDRSTGKLLLLLRHPKKSRTAKTSIRATRTTPVLGISRPVRFVTVLHQGPFKGDTTICM